MLALVFTLLLAAAVLVFGAALTYWAAVNPPPRPDKTMLGFGLLTLTAGAYIALVAVGVITT